MPKKQSSSRLSTIAGRVLERLNRGLRTPSAVYIALIDQVRIADVKALAASVLSQDEKRGQQVADVVDRFAKKRGLKTSHFVLPKVTTFTVKPGKDFGWRVLEGRVQVGFSPKKADAITIARQQAARLKPSRVVLRVAGGSKTVKEYK